MTTEPRCPYCNAQGLAHITAKDLGGVLLIYCGQCGAIHGVAPLLAAKKEAPGPAEDRSAPPGPQPPPDRPNRPEPEPPPPRFPRQPHPDPYQKDPPLSPEEALSFWSKRSAGQHGFYTRMASEDAEDEEDK